HWCYKQDRVPLQDQAYFEVTPVDIFGQGGKPVNSNKVDLKNLQYPVPPKNLKVNLNQNTQFWSNPYLANLKSPKELNTAELQISMEYGHNQFRSSPDVDKLKLVYAIQSAPPPNPPLEADPTLPDNLPYSNQWS